jgi:hypothetical protein
MKSIKPSLVTLLAKLAPLGVFSHNVPPVLIETAEVAEIEPVLPLPICKDPAVIVVGPV